MLIELQSHSTVSDGQLAPAEVVEEAAKAGVTTLALTDHDAVAGVPEAEEAARALGIELVPAIEMSCVHEYAEDLHICGYWVDLERIAPACERAQLGRRERAGEIVENLRREGFDLTLDDAIREAGAADSIGRPHIARAAGASGDLGPFFEEYLVPGAKAFVPRRWPSAEQAIELIREAGGVAVIAHPYWDISEPDKVEHLIRSLGADGIETFYPSHSKEQTEHLLALCDELGLVPTASSDYHGPTHKTFAEFGAYDTYGLGEPQVPARALSVSRGEDLAHGALQVRVRRQLRALGRLIRAADAGQVGDLARPRLRVEALGVAPLALLQRRVDEDLVEGDAGRLVGGADLVAGVAVKGLTRETIATTPDSAISFATSPTRRTFSARSDSLKPRSALRPWRRLSPSSM